METDMKFKTLSLHLPLIMEMKSRMDLLMVMPSGYSGICMARLKIWEFQMLI